MPYITKEYLNKNTKNISRRIISVSTFIIILSLLIVLIFELFGDKLLLIIYKTTLGNNYLKILTPFFVLQYLQNIYLFTINGLGKNKDLFTLSIISLITRLTTMTVLGLLKTGIYSYIISIIINIIISTSYLIKKTYKYLN